MDFNDFHFIRPLFLALLPLGLGLGWWMKRAQVQTDWNRYLPAEALAVLRIAGKKGTQRLPVFLSAIWLLVCLAASGPSWISTEVPTVQNEQALVIILDLSPSMLAEDLKPNRLTRAKLKVVDALRLLKDGQVALVAYAGDAHAVSPLTDDPLTIQALLPALAPSTMPVAGSNIEAAVELAVSLLKAANAPSGSLLLISDSIDPNAIDGAVEAAQGYSVSILGVGTSNLSPIPASTGGFLKNSQGEIVLAKLDAANMTAVSSATGGRFALLSSTQSDIESLINTDADGALNQNSDQVAEQWQDLGYLAAILAVPFMLLLFRRGLIYVVLLTLFVPLDGHAEESRSLWSSLWQTSDQYAQRLYENGHFDSAAEAFDDPEWSMAAHYKADKFDSAVELSQKLDENQNTSARTLYNQANALAMSGDLEAALESYNKALEKDPENEDAAFNKSVVEDLLNQQEPSEQEQSEQEQSEQEQSEQEQSEQEQSEQEQSEQEQSEQEQSEQEQSEQEQSEQEQSEQEQSEQEQSEQEQSEQEQSEQEQSEEEQAAELEETEASLDDQSEQWLRAIPDDPSGFLRRKFEYEYQQKQRESNANKRDDDADPRY